MKFTRDQTISLCNFFIQKKFLKKCSNLILSFILNFQVFELVTGDFLFEPHSSDDYSRDEGTNCVFLLVII